MTPRTKAGADLEDEYFYLDTSEPGEPNTLIVRIRAIEDEMLDKVAAAVPCDSPPFTACDGDDLCSVHAAIAALREEGR